MHVYEIMSVKTCNVLNKKIDKSDKDGETHRLGETPSMHYDKDGASD
jgi:hypothetical protein